MSSAFYHLLLLQTKDVGRARHSGWWLMVGSLNLPLQTTRLRHFTANYGERKGSVVECLTRDWSAAGSSLTCVTALWSLSKTHYPSLVLVQPRKTGPYITERLLIGRKESNQTKQIKLKSYMLTLPNCSRDLWPMKRHGFTIWSLIPVLKQTEEIFLIDLWRPTFQKIQASCMCWQCDSFWFLGLWGNVHHQPHAKSIWILYWNKWIITTDRRTPSKDGHFLKWPS